MTGIIKDITKGLDFIFPGISDEISSVLLFLNFNITIGLATSGELANSFKKPKDPPAEQPRGRHTMVRQPITTRKIIFGETRISGSLVLWETTDNNRFHHLVLPLCDQESNRIGTVFANDTPIYEDQIDGNGDVTSGRYAGKLRIKKHLGSPGQVADPDLVAEVEKWTSEHRGREVTYIYFRVDFDLETYPTGIPSFSAVVQGQKLLDPRTSTTRWSPNAALALRSYLLNPRYGRKGLTASGIDDTFFNADANTCEEFVAAPNITHDVTGVDTGNDELTLDGTRLKFRFKNKVRLTNTGFLSLPGEAGDYASTPDAAALDITGDIDLRCDAAADDWSNGFQVIIAKSTETGDQRSYSLLLDGDGKLEIVWSTDGTAPGILFAISTVPLGLINGAKNGLRVTLKVNNGAGGRDIKFFLNDPLGIVITADGKRWTQVGTTITQAGITSIFSGTAILELGSATIGTSFLFKGKIYRAQVLNGIDGTVEFDAEFDQEADGTTSFTESSAQAATVTINQSGDPKAEILNSLPAPLAVKTDYFVIVSSLAGRVVRLATSRQNANDNIFIDLVDTGTGTHTLALEILHTVQSVDTTNDVLELDGEKLAFQTGDKLQLTTTDTLPAGLALATDYYAIVHHEQEVLDDDDAVLERCAIQLASSYFNALDRIAIDITGTGTGTHTVVKQGEPRYTCNGMVDSAEDPFRILTNMLTSMAGTLTRIGGTWKSLAGVYRSPTLSLDEGDVRGPISTPTRISARDRFNRVKGTYFNPQNDWQPSDFPAVTKLAYQTADKGIIRDTEVDLPYTSRSQTAQRLVLIILNRMRQEIAMETIFSAKAYKAQAGDTENISNVVRGWTDKIFEVVDSTPGFVPDDKGVPIWVVKQLLQETAASVYDFNPDVDEVVIDDAPNTNLPNPFAIDPPSNLTVTEEIYVTRDGTGVKVRAILTWSASPDTFAKEYQVEHKLPADSIWIVQPTTRALTLHLDDLAPDTWDFRVKAINLLDKSSTYAPKTQQIFGLLAAPTEPQNLTLSIVGGTAYLRWDKSTDVDVRVGGRYIIRHSKKLTGATWTESVTIGPAIGGQEVLALLPLKAGTYMMKAVDSSNVFSVASASVSTKQASMSSFTTTDTLTESPNFTGAKVNTEVISNILKLTSGGGGVDPSGTYTFSGAFDFGAVVSRRITTLIDALVVNVDDLIDDRLDLIDDWLDFDGTLQANADAVVFMRQTDDDPTGSPTWGPWERVESGEVEAWGVELRVQLTSDNTGFNMEVSELTVKAESID